jgi:hypothetical protein
VKEGFEHFDGHVMPLPCCFSSRRCACVRYVALRKPGVYDEPTIALEINAKHQSRCISISLLTLPSAGEIDSAWSVHPELPSEVLHVERSRSLTRKVLTLQTPYPRAPPHTCQIIDAVRYREAIVALFAFVVTTLVSQPSHYNSSGMLCRRTRKTDNSNNHLSL